MEISPTQSSVSSYNQERLNQMKSTILAAQSHVAVSFEVPEYTANADALGASKDIRSDKISWFRKKN